MPAGAASTWALYPQGHASRHQLRLRVRRSNYRSRHFRRAYVDLTSPRRHSGGRPRKDPVARDAADRRCARVRSQTLARSKTRCRDGHQSSRAPLRSRSVCLAQDGQCPRLHDRSSTAGVRRSVATTDGPDLRPCSPRRRAPPRDRDPNVTAGGRSNRPGQRERDFLKAAFTAESVAPAPRCRAAIPRRLY